MYNFLIIRKYIIIPQKYKIRTRTILQQCFPVFATTPMDIQNATLELKGSWYLLFLCKRIIGCALVQDNLLSNVCIFPTFQGKGYGTHFIECIIEKNSFKKLTVNVDEKKRIFYEQFNLDIV